MSDHLRQYENEDDEDDNSNGRGESPIPQDEENAHFDETTQEIDRPSFVDVSEKDLPKRVLLYSSEKLLRLFGKNLKSSVDGTFKSACYLSKQNFVMMLKFKGQWIPAIHGWLPDKKEESYKVV